MRIPMLGDLINGPNGENSLRLEEALGRGNFGDVFKAVGVEDGTLYAVKFPLVTVIGDVPEMRAFLNEVQAAHQIQHPNVVKIVHVEEAPPNLPPYLVMEFIESGTLKSYLDRFSDQRQLVDVVTLGDWSRGLVNGIAAINEKMLHRDLKPDNILMDGNIPKIGDFGLSKVVGAATRSKTFKGGQHMLYMAPEGWKQETNEIQIDMYAMGIVLYEVAALDYPYPQPSDFRNPRAFEDMHLYQKPRPLGQLRSDLPPEFVTVVTRLLEKRPGDRFSNWDEVKHLLERGWGSSRSGEVVVRPIVQEIQSEISRLHDLSTGQRLEAERVRQEQEERRRLDEHQITQLTDLIRQTVSELNEQKGLGEIRDANTLGAGYGKDRLGFVLPYSGGDIVTVQFFSIDPPLNLDKQTVRLAAQISDPDKAGFNCLLLKNIETDLYGQWRVCKVRHAAGLGPAYARIEPFGLDERNIRHIEMAYNANHIYQLDWSSDVGEAFCETLLNALRRKGNTR